MQARGTVDSFASKIRVVVLLFSTEVNVEANGLKMTTNFGAMPHILHRFRAARVLQISCGPERPWAALPLNSCRDAVFR